MLPHEKRKRQGLMQDIDSESIWTADIVLQLDFLLETHKADYVFCTKTFAVDDAYIDVGYYRASFGVDKKRVEIAFSQLLAQRGKNLFSTSHLPLTLVLNAVCSPNCIAIVLLDNHILYAKDTDMNGEDQYSGHYVILSGISRATEDIATAHIQDGSSGQDKEDFCVVLANVSYHYWAPLEHAVFYNGVDSHCNMLCYLHRPLAARKPYYTNNACDSISIRAIMESERDRQRYNLCHSAMMED